jgi:preprotein translocase subunit SecA
MLKNPFTNNSLVNRYQSFINQINTLEADLKGLTDSELRAKSLKLKKQYDANQNLDALIPESFALTREASLPAFLNALTKKGVHIVTVNDYLANRDQVSMGQIYRFLGLNTGLIQEGMSTFERRENYNADITYVTNYEVTFDFLRDNMALNLSDVVLRPFNYCIVDEVDSILIDEAQTPLMTI